jgi:hypothetical protein
MSIKAWPAALAATLIAAAILAGGSAARPYLERGDLVKPQAKATTADDRTNPAAPTQSSTSAASSAANTQSPANHRSVCFGDDGKIPCPSHGKPVKNRHTVFG